MVEQMQKAPSGRYQPYPEYKDSGVEWLGKIPSHWELSKIKYIAPFEVGWTPPTKYEENFIGENLWANISDLKDKFIFTTKNKISDRSIQQSGMRIVPKGSLLYSFKLSVGNVSFAGNNLYTNEAIASFLVNSKLPLPYLYYALPIFIVKNASINIYNALILNQDLIKNAYLLDFSYFEAQKIAQFLDYETAKIDLLIEKQQKLIELLKEKRQAVISHAVTKGLDPNVEMKDSGVEWLGEVPAHWEVLPLKFYLKQIQTGTTPASSNENYFDGSINWFTPGDFNSEYLISSKRKISQLAIDKNEVKMFPGATVLIVGIGATSGKVAYLNEPASFNQQITGFDFLTKVYPKYMYYFFTHFKKIFLSIANYTTLPILNNDFFKNLKVILPDLDIQHKTIKYLDTQTSKIDLLIEKAEAQITLMQERRAALISAAVTGKIDLRHWQMPEASDHQGGDNE